MPRSQEIYIHLFNRVYDRALYLCAVEGINISGPKIAVLVRLAVGAILLHELEANKWTR